MQRMSPTWKDDLHHSLTLLTRYITVSMTLSALVPFSRHFVFVDALNLSYLLFIVAFKQCNPKTLAPWRPAPRRISNLRKEESPPTSGTCHSTQQERLPRSEGAHERHKNESIRNGRQLSRRGWQSQNTQTVTPHHNSDWSPKLTRSTPKNIWNFYNCNNRRKERPENRTKSKSKVLSIPKYKHPHSERFRNEKFQLHEPRTQLHVQQQVRSRLWTRSQKRKRRQKQRWKRTNCLRSLEKCRNFTWRNPNHFYFLPSLSILSKIKHPNPQKESRVPIVQIKTDRQR